jgi:hypothetical protein
MAEIRCPMCSRLNPDELEICQFCQARLKPLIAKPNEPTPDWLNQTEDDENLDDSTGINQPVAPDWLRSLRSREISHEDLSEDQSMGDPPDWLRAGVDAPDLLSAQRRESNDSDWLADFRSRQSDEEPTETEPVQQEIEEEKLAPLDVPDTTDAEIPDWLSNARFDNDTVNEPAEPELSQPDTDAEPEWLARLRSVHPTEGVGQVPEPSADKDEIPDWLKADGQDFGSAAVDQSFESAPEEEVPTWTSYFEKEGDSADLVTDLNELKSTEDELLIPEGDLPDWLKDGSHQPGPNAEPGEPEIRKDSEQLPDDSPPWYATAPGRPFKPTDQLSQWLRLEASEPDSSEPIPAEEIPDWLKADKEDLVTQSLTPKLEELSIESEPVSLDEGLSSSQFEKIPETQLTDAELHYDEDKADLDDDFALLEKKLFPDGELEQALVSTPEGDDLQAVDDPLWLVELRQKMGDSVEDQGLLKVSPFSEDIEHELPAEAMAGQAIPDWLIDVHAQEAIEHITGDSEPLEISQSFERDSENGLVQADLPTWLEAMRPVEAVAAAAADIMDEHDQSIEKAGPLVGLKGVLPAEPDVTLAHKPDSFGLKLQVSDMQRTRADMLQELVQNEALAKPLPRKPAISSQRILQVVIAVTLILAILSTLIIDTPIAKVPGFPIETGAVSELINNLSSSDRVLVALDFQPAFSGEMEAIGATVLDHLMLRGAQIAFISTNPSGPLQAERLVNIVNQRYDHSYAGQQITNLGYISGGRAGILAFASTPRQLAPLTFDSENNPWDSGSLRGVSKASDFALTMVITENADTARMWIEQFQPELESKPLIMVLSAQAAPIIRPYYAGSPQQVQGIVSGMSGAAAYENLLGRVGIARSQWGAFSLGVLAACILILLGGIINAFPIIGARMQKTNPGGDDQL